MERINQSILTTVAITVLVTIAVSCGINKKISRIENGVKHEIIKSKPIESSQLNIISNCLFDGPQKTIFQDALRSFEFENQEILLNLSFPKDIYDHASVFNSQEKFIAKTVTSYKPKWDIVNINDNFSYIAEVLNDKEWAKNYLVDFSEIPEFRASSKPEILNEKFKKEWGGIVPGPAISGEYYCLYYNKKLADQLGIRIKTQNMTFEDFKSYLKSVKHFNYKNPNSKIRAFYERKNQYSTSILATQLFASLFEDLNEFTDESFADSKLDKWYKVLEALEELAIYQIWDKDEAGINDNFHDDNTLFYLASSIQFCQLNEIKDIYSSAQLPGLQLSILYPLHYNVMWAVPKNAPNKEKAIKLLLSLNSRDIAEQWIQKTKCPTGIKCNENNLSFINNSQQDFSSYIRNNFSDGKYKIKPDNAFVFGKINEAIQTYDFDVLSGKMTAQDAKERILEQIRQPNNQMTYNN